MVPWDVACSTCSLDGWASHLFMMVKGSVEATNDELPFLLIDLIRFERGVYAFLNETKYSKNIAVHFLYSPRKNMIKQHQPSH